MWRDYDGERTRFFIGGIVFLILAVVSLVVNSPVNLAETAIVNQVGKRAYLRAEDYTISERTGTGEYYVQSTHGGRYSEPMDTYILDVNLGGANTYKLYAFVKEGKLDNGKVNLYGQFVKLTEKVETPSLG